MFELYEAVINKEWESVYNLSGEIQEYATQKMNGQPVKGQ